MRPSSRIPALGPRGEGWVALQSLLFALIVACSFANVDWPGGVSRVLEPVGAIVMAAGFCLFVDGIRSLGRSLTPLPKPDPRSTLRRGGAFARSRNPIYGGVLLLALGWSLAGAPLALAPTVLLWALFELKSRREEIWLVERYPEYAAYRAAVRRRFVPWVY